MNITLKKINSSISLLFVSVLLVYPGIAISGNRLNMGFYYPSINDTTDRTDIEVSLKFWTEELTEEIDITESNASLYDTIASLKDAFENGEIDMIIAPPFSIARYFNRASLADGIVAIRENGEFNSLLLLANKDRVNSVDDIKGKKLIMPENDELAEIFLETLTLKRFNKHYRNIFSTIQVKFKNNRIVLDLFFNKADVALVYASTFDVMVELNPQIKKRIKILSSYPVKAKNFSYFSKDYPLRNLLIKKALSFGEFPRAKQIMAVYKTPELDYCRVDELLMFDKLFKEYKQLIKANLR